MIVTYMVVVLAFLGALIYLLVGANANPTFKETRLAELARITFACAMFAICFHYAALLVRL